MSEKELEPGLDFEKHRQWIIDHMPPIAIRRHERLRERMMESFRENTIEAEFTVVNEKQVDPSELSPEQKTFL